MSWATRTGRFRSRSGCRRPDAEDRMPKTTVSDYLARASGAGIRYADIAAMSEEAVEALLFQRPELPTARPVPDWNTVAAELTKRGVTLMLLWEEYRQQHRDGYRYSQFR